MILSYHCPSCSQWLQAEIAPASPTTTELNCPSCHWQRTIPEADFERDDDFVMPKRCLACGNEDLWRQKDFPKQIGLLAVVAGAVLSSIAWYYYRPVLALGILMVFAAVDMVLFAILPDLLVCYRCQARHHGADTSEREAFELELAERYRQEAARLEESAKRAEG